jgi:hypothetical protein
MATLARTPIKFTAAVPRTSPTQFIEVDDWVVEELESDWRKLLRRITNLYQAKVKGKPSVPRGSERPPWFQARPACDTRQSP